MRVGKQLIAAVACLVLGALSVLVATASTFDQIAESELSKSLRLVRGALQTQQHERDARLAIKAATALFPQDADLWRRRAHVHYVLCRRSDSDCESVTHLLREAVKRRPSSADAWASLAIQLATYDAEGSRNAIRRAVRFGPHEGGVGEATVIVGLAHWDDLVGDETVVVSSALRSMVDRLDITSVMFLESLPQRELRDRLLDQLGLMDVYKEGSRRHLTRLGLVAPEKS